MMGCAGSKAVDKAVSSDASAPPAEVPPATQENTDDVDAVSGLPASKVPPTLDEARHDERFSQVRESRLSVRYQAKEIPSDRGSSMSRKTSSCSRSSAPFDQAQVGTHTRHGIMPGPRGFSAAKINQDRGVVCWPFNGSYDQALLCIFDGHGSKGERVSEFCMNTVPELLEAEPDELQADPLGCLTKNVIKCDELLFAGSPDLALAPRPTPTPPPARFRRARRGGNELRHHLDRRLHARGGGIRGVLRRLARRPGHHLGRQGARSRPLSGP